MLTLLNTMEATIPENENARLAALASYQILDTLPEQSYDDLTRLASSICGAPMALISLIDQDRQWIKSRVGVDVTETPRSVAFCAHTILHPQEMLIVPDARQDPRFADNPFVQGEPHVRFYAGAPLVTSAGHALGSLCVVDHTPRNLTPQQQEDLQALARQVMVQLELRRTLVERKLAEEELRLSEIRYRTLFESNPYPMWIYDRVTLEFLAVNDAAVNHYGYSRDEFLGMTLKDIRPPEEIPVLLASISKPRRANGKQGILRHRKKDGTVMEMEITSHDLSSEARPVRLTLANDVTARLAAEKQISFQAHLLNEVGQAVIATDTQGTVIYWNRYAETLYGWAAQEALGQKINTLTVPEIAVAQAEQIIAQLRRGERWSGEFTVQHRNGTTFPAAVTNTPIYDEAGAMIGIIGISQDITQRKKAEATLLKANDELEMHIMERTAELKAANDSLRVENIEHQVTMETLREVAAALQVAKEEAERANAAKSEFLSRMSHELRTPLNAILGFGQVLESEDLPEEQRECVDHILQGGNHLLALINEVLDISRVEAGNVALDTEAVGLEEVVAEACALLRPFAAQQNIPIEMNIAALAGVHLLADRQRLSQVLINLLSNAIKYNRPGGRVNIVAHRVEKHRIQIRIEDSGHGLSPQEIKKLFTPFERLHAIDRGIEGTGLGLVISQRLIDAMSGTLGVESEVGKGSTFWIELTQAQVIEETPPQSGTFPISLERWGDLRLIDPVIGDQVIDGQKTARTHTYMVLCIEDNLSNMRLIEAILESRPEISVRGAIQGSIGLDIAREYRPDLILLDLHLPGLSGSEVLEQLQHSETTKEIPVIVVSADATAQQIDCLLAAGAAAYFTKPLNVAAFLTTVDNLLQKNTNR